MAKKEGTKLCKHCKTEIPAGAKVCPNCRKKQGGIVKWIVIGVIVLAVIGSVAGGGDSSSDKKAASNNTEAETQEEQKQIEYTPCNINDMMQELNDNAMSASDKYKDQYLEVTGTLSNIDSDGKYISLLPDDDFAVTGIQCYIKNDEQKQAVANMSKGDTVTLKGKCTSVGEVFGYSLDIDSIE